MLNRNDLVALLFLLVETAFSLYRLYPQYLQPMYLGPKARMRPRLRLVGNDVPTVDVLIFYCGEEVSVLLDTVRAACMVDYPSHKFRVVVLDDSAAVSGNIDTLRTHFPNLSYSTRRNRRAPSQWHKAGNINHGLSYVASLPGGPNKLVAGLDVDMIPERDWLRRLAPHLIQDPNIGLVSPNQRFYNLPTGDHLGQLLQFEELQVRNLRRDFGNAGLGGGSGWLARRAALDTIAGFATDSILEDWMTCVNLTEAGWSICILDEDLQWGLVPDSFNGHIRQIQRWTTAMLSFYKALSTRSRKWLAFKWIAEISTATYIIGMNLCYFGLPLMLLSGQPFVRCANHKELRFLLGIACLDFMAHTTNGLLESWVADSTIYCWQMPNHLWHAPSYLVPGLRHWFPTITTPVFGRSAFKTATSAANKSSEDRYRSWKRLQILLKESHMASHIFVLSACISGLIVSLFKVWSHPDMKFILTHMGWPPAFFLWTSVLKNALVPFNYALFVPPRPDRESFLALDESDILRPTSAAKDRKHRQVSEWHLCLVGAYYAIALLGSLWL